MASHALDQVPFAFRRGGTVHQAGAPGGRPSGMAGLLNGTRGAGPSPDGVQHRVSRAAAGVECAKAPGARREPVLPALLAATVLATTACGESPPPRSAQPTTASRLAEGPPADVVTGLKVPWSVVIVGDEALISERDRGDILAFRPGEPPRLLATVPNVATPVDGGVLGLAVLRQDGRVWIYAFHSTTVDNRIVRMPYARGALGAPQLVLAGVPVGQGHNGGRIAFGPDGMLYAATGETRKPALAQDPRSLAGKILRMTPEGRAPDDNPIVGSLVYSLGHRNPQGLAWDAQGRLWATEFGDKGWDEFNRIEPGRNYGWPLFEGRAANPAYVDPVVQWRTTEMGPSGLAYVDGAFFIAGLTGQRLWSVTFDDAGRPVATPYYVGVHGRVRDVVRGLDGSLWFVTNNTDGRGDTPDPGDDRILSIPLSALSGSKTTSGETRP